MTHITAEKFTDIFPVFRKAPEELVEGIISASQLQNFPAGLQIYLEGDACSAIALVLSGGIRVYKTGEGGREITLYDIEKGENCILNASCILSRHSYPANAVTTEAGEILLIPAADFKRLIERYEQMRDFVFTILSERLGLVMALVEEIAFGRLDRRLTEYIQTKSADGKLQITHQKIADDLGTSREVVSRILKDFERKGLVRLSRNLIELSLP